LKVIDKRNGGKADALNVGINVATGRLILAVDADVILDADAVTHLARPFIEDDCTVATSGMIRPQNGTTIENGRIGRTGLPVPMLERMQVLEYLRAYGVGRLCFNWIGAHLIISGAFGLFDRKTLIALGGYQPHAVGEDMELVVRIHRHLREARVPYRVSFSADALCLTEAPFSRVDFGKQRTRWHMGLLSTLRIHRYMMLNPRYGAIGFVAFPFFVVELFAPVLEALALIGFPLAWLTGAVSGERALWMVLTGVLLSTSVSLFAVLIDTAGFDFLTGLKPRLVLAMLGFVEHVGYRQLTILYRLRAFERYYRTIQLRSGWKSPTRAPARPAAGADPSSTAEPT
jgi:cellulose synthase/poly-beta-1,6-N-acetylglucosamine synthase-like glycosyltransferase